MSTTTLSQTQIIQSLGRHLELFEQELAWGVAPAELRHLTGRIGELYAAMITRGQMAFNTNQPGYDVVSDDGERVSVKTYTTFSSASIKASTLDQVDRIIVLRLLIDDGDLSIQEDIDFLVSDQDRKGAERAGKIVIPCRVKPRRAEGGRVPIEALRMMRETEHAQFEEYKFTRFENSSVIVEKSGEVLPVAKPTLRKAAKALGVSVLRENGRRKNTRTLGRDVIRAINANANPDGED